MHKSERGFISTKQIFAYFAVSLLSLSAYGATAQSNNQPTAVSPPVGSVGGLGDVNLFPKRVVLEGRRQISSIGLYNKTANEGDYEIRLVDMAMTTEGRLISFDNGLSEADKARVNTASQFLRFSPRRVTLRGSEAQTIRIMARASAELPDGEYRSHFMVTAIPRDAGGFSIEDATSDTSESGIGVTIRPRFGISIPVIVRIGDTTLDVGITNARVLTARDGSQAVAFTLTRKGTRSAFGDLAITRAGASEPLVIAKGIGVYPEVDHRDLLLPIERTADQPPVTSGAQITISYVDDDFSPGSQLAETSFTVP